MSVLQAYLRHLNPVNSPIIRMANTGTWKLRIEDVEAHLQHFEDPIVVVSVPEQKLPIKLQKKCLDMKAPDFHGLRVLNDQNRHEMLRGHYFSKQMACDVYNTIESVAKRYETKLEAERLYAAALQDIEKEESWQTDPVLIREQGLT